MTRPRTPDARGTPGGGKAADLERRRHVRRPVKRAADHRPQQGHPSPRSPLGALWARPLGFGQPLVGSLLNASQEAVGGFSGWIAGTGRNVDLAPGESASIGVIFGTASIREELGYALPPGRYWLKVQTSFRPGPGEPPYALTAPLTQITVVPRVREIGEETGPSRPGGAAGSRPGPAGRD